MTKQKAPHHVMRGILRLLKSPPLPKELLRKEEGATSSTTAVGRYNAVQQFVLEQYRQHQHDLPTSAESVLRRQNALNYYHMKCDLVERGRLYKLDTGAEVQLSGTEMSRRAAARAGLQLPKLNPDLD